MSDALGLLEVKGWSASMVALDCAEKAASIRVVQVEINDMLGAQMKFVGSTSDVRAALDAGREMAERMVARDNVVTHVIPRPHEEIERLINSKPEFSPLIEQDMVVTPRNEASMSEQAPFAIGMIETQGLTAVIEAIDTAVKAANVEILGKEKLGGGYVTVLIKGDVAAVKAAIAAGQERVGALGKLVAAHVIARPSTAVLSLLPKV